MQQQAPEQRKTGKGGLRDPARSTRQHTREILCEHVCYISSCHYVHAHDVSSSHSFKVPTMTQKRLLPKSGRPEGAGNVGIAASPASPGSVESGLQLQAWGPPGLCVRQGGFPNLCVLAVASPRPSKTCLGSHPHSSFSGLLTPLFI